MSAPLLYCWKPSGLHVYVTYKCFCTELKCKFRNAEECTCEFNGVILELQQVRFGWVKKNWVVTSTTSAMTTPPICTCIYIIGLSDDFEICRCLFIQFFFVRSFVHYCCNVSTLHVCLPSRTIKWRHLIRNSTWSEKQLLIGILQLKSENRLNV